MKNFIIIGMPGSGKSSIGRIVAKKTGLKFIDIDELIVKRHGNIADIFENEGENKFREYETKALSDAADNRNTIISAGGGIIERGENLNILKNNIVIFIDRDIKNIYSTLDSDSRPLLKDKEEALLSLYKRRSRKYITAMDYKVDNNSSKNNCILEIYNIIKLLICP